MNKLVMTSVTAEYPSTYKAVSQARRSVAAFAQRCGFDSGAVFDIVLATGEACNNAVEHGDVANGRFVVNTDFDGKAMTVDVQDSGRGFDLTGHGLAMPPDERGVRGLGIFIMRALMDEVVYSRDTIGTTVRL